MKHWWNLSALLLLGACSSQGQPLSDVDAGHAPDASESCQAFASRTCSDNAVHFQDDCGVLGELIEECTGGSQCSSSFARCCTAALSSGSMPALPWPVAVNWTFDPGAVLVATVNVHEDPGENLEMAFDIEVRFEGELYFFSLENFLAPSGEPASKKGIRFYNVRSGDPAAVRTSTGTIAGNSTEQRIELPYFWSAGHTYTFQLSRAESQSYDGGVADWFDLTVNEDGGAATVVGGVLVPRDDDAEPVRTPTDIRTHYKIVNYDWVSPPATLSGENADYSLLTAAMDISLDITVDGNGNKGLSSTYGVDANAAEWSNVDVGYDQNDELRVAFGGGVSTCHPDGAITRP